MENKQNRDKWLSYLGEKYQEFQEKYVVELDGESRSKIEAYEKESGDDFALMLLGLDDFKKAPMCSNGLNYAIPMKEEHYAAIGKIEQAIEKGCNEGHKALCDIYAGYYGILNRDPSTKALAKEHFAAYYGLEGEELDQRFEEFDNEAWQRYKEIKSIQHRRLIMNRAAREGDAPTSSIDPDLKKENPNLK